MEFLTKNNIDKQNFSLFIRDLSETLNTNLKHTIEDTLNEDTLNNTLKESKGKKKKVVKKKKDIIIEEQNKKRLKIKIEDDYNKINFLNENIDLDNLIN